MRLLATLSDMKRLGVILNLKSGVEDIIPVHPAFKDPSVLGRAVCRPFGITWSAKELFIANNRQLLVFDKRLQYLRTLHTSLQVNTHQLARHGAKVWAVSPWTNSLIGISHSSKTRAVEFNLLDQKVRNYVSRRATEADDKHHFNSLLWAEGHLFIAAHAFGEGSFIKQYDATTLQLTSVRQNVGTAIHGLAHDNGELFWISSGTGEIRSSSGYRHKLSSKGYPRGFAMTPEYFIVAISEFLSRDKRHGGDSWIHVINRRQNTLEQEVKLNDTGSINDIRLLDEYDYAHQLAPFWRKR